MQGWIALENGSVFFGESFGFEKTIEGELVFNTSMTGYQEALTDPSYAGQILMFTFPQIGNYGCDKEAYESNKIQTQACIVKEWCRKPYQGEMNLDEWFKKEKIPAIEGIDTRELTIMTREVGTLRAVMCTDGTITPEEGVKRAANMSWPSEQNLVAEVSTSKIYKKGNKGPRVTLYDWGVKQSIVTNLAKKNIECQVIHNASVLTAVAGILGLQHYNFGPVATLVLPEGNYKPLSPIDKIKTNMQNGNHSLVLLDIKADQPDKEPVYMTATQAAEQMIEAGIPNDTKVAVAARVGREDQELWYGKLKYLANRDLGKEPHSIVVPSRLHFTEKEFLENL